MLRPPNGRREKILLYGRFNSGKSRAWQSVADWRERTGATFDMWVADTDDCWDAQRPADGRWDQFVHVTRLDVDDYRPWIDWARGVKQQCSRDDWVVVDLHKARDAAEGYYWETQEGDLLADVYYRNQLNVESKGREGEARGGAYGSRFQVIKKYYDAFHSSVMGSGCHILCLAHADEVREYHKPEVRNQYRVGWKPEGREDLPNMFNTVLFASQVADSWVLTSVREKGPIDGSRELLKGSTVDDFVVTYLFGVAGWRP